MIFYKIFNDQYLISIYIMFMMDESYIDMPIYIYISIKFVLFLFINIFIYFLVKYIHVSTPEKTSILKTFRLASLSVIFSSEVFFLISYLIFKNFRG